MAPQANFAATFSGMLILQPSCGPSVFGTLILRPFLCPFVLERPLRAHFPPDLWRHFSVLKNGTKNGRALAPPQARTPGARERTGAASAAKVGGPPASIFSPSYIVKWTRNFVGTTHLEKLRILEGSAVKKVVLQRVGVCDIHVAFMFCGI